MSKDSDYEEVSDFDVEVIDESIYRPVKVVKPRTAHRKWIVLGGLTLILIIVLGFAFSDRLIPAKPRPISIEIEYIGRWSGSIGDGNGQRAVNGSGPRAYDMGDGTVVAVIQKGDTSNRTLTVRIMEGEDVVEDQSNATEFGVVSVSHRF